MADESTPAAQSSVLYAASKLMSMRCGAESVVRPRVFVAASVHVHNRLCPSGCCLMLQAVVRVLSIQTLNQLRAIHNVHTRRLPHLLRRVHADGKKKMSQEVPRVHRRLELHCEGTGSFDVLSISPSQAPALHVHFVPGNPGIASFYEKHLTDLHDQLGGRASIKAIEHQLTQCNLQRVDAPILVLAGHSIGAYIALECMRRLAAKGGKQRVCVIGVHPFLTVNTDSAFQRFATYVSLRPYLESICLAFGGGASAVMSWLPVRLKLALLSRQLASMDAASAAITERFACSPSSFTQFLEMGLSEMRNHQKPPDYPFLAAHAKRIAFIYASGPTPDPWAPEHHFEEMRARVPEIATAGDDGHWGHAYCVQREGSLSVARTSARLIAQLLAEDGYGGAGPAPADQEQGSLVA